MLVNVPLLFGLITVAPLAIPVLIGAKWEPVVPLIQLMSVMGLCVTLTAPLASLLLGSGKAKWAFIWNIAQSLIAIPVFFLVLQFHGLLWGTAALALVHVVQVGIAYHVLLRPLCGLGILSLFQTATPTFILSGVMAVTVFALPLVVDGPDSAILAAQVIVGGALYVLLAFVFLRPFVLDLLAHLSAPKARSNTV